MFFWLIVKCSLIDWEKKKSEDLLETSWNSTQSFLVEVCLHSGCEATSFKYQCKTAESAIYAVYYTKYPAYFLNQNGVDRSGKMSISWIFNVEMLENCRFVKVEFWEFRLLYDLF